MAHKQTETDAFLLMSYLDVNGPTHWCEVDDALGFNRARVIRLSKYLLRETAENVILPSGMSVVAHTSPLTHDPCQCGTLSFNYDAKTAKAWYGRRLAIVETQARNIYEMGTQLQAQFPRAQIMARLAEDARRVMIDVEQAMEWLQR